VLLDTPDGTFWRHWMDFVDNAVIADHYIDENDMCLVRLCTSTRGRGEIDHFFSNYVSFDVRGDRGYIKIPDVPTQRNSRRSRTPYPVRSGTRLRARRRHDDLVRLRWPQLRELATLD